jgi:hypothetical protein
VSLSIDPVVRRAQEAAKLETDRRIKAVEERVASIADTLERTQQIVYELRAAQSGERPVDLPRLGGGHFGGGGPYMRGN